MGVMNPGVVMKSIIPVVMAGVLGIYGLITGVILNGKLSQGDVGEYSSYGRSLGYLWIDHWCYIEWKTESR